MRKSGLLILSVAASVAYAAPAVAAGADVGDCFADLMNGRSSDIVCEFPVRPNEAETAELLRQSRGFVKTANCTVSIRIERALVTAALETPNYVFQATPQPVKCEITAKGRQGDMVLPVAATFAPKVTIAEGRAVDATPGLANVDGVPRPLSWPVEMWVNGAGYVRSGMLQVINAWLDHMRNDRPRRSAQR